ncbi:NAD(P)H-dependent oxidoreductase subunit E [Thermosipho ferrireducens]|uniref:NAD(P)H-dependent oxidoreductase subunit E n=1 Tax=Thermosipho ferrireducens TaxID=2571116 RepID=A0ABX7S7F2_9BACT|nr:NAD(P)H-dependent oxidoreductase subunit E [Thermosipho ferrireducens]QTA38533.1 NAD(P)H-dependent oxidoreductase subunit E [Thermosipho ferrireducens]
MVIRICMGSSCHLKGSYQVVEKVKELGIKDLKLLGSLCFGKCERGINIEIDGKLFSNVTPENVKNIVKKFIKEGE